MAGFLPGSEGDLFRHRPGSNRPNTFPAEALLGGEKILFETRPGYFGLHRGLIFGSLPFVVLMLLVEAAAAAQGPSTAAIIGVFLFFSLIPMLYAWNSWRRTAYALTDQRVLVRSGETFDSATYDQIRSVSLKSGTSRIIFELAPPPGGTKGWFKTASPRLTWTAVLGAPGVASFAQSAATFYRLRIRQAQLRQDLTVASLQDRVVCQYCGAFIDVNTLSGENPRCPRCSAPFTVAPTGV